MRASPSTYLDAQAAPLPEPHGGVIKNARRKSWRSQDSGSCSASACWVQSVSWAALKPNEGAVRFDWNTVVNNNDQMPGAPGGLTFNSFNQPSVNKMVGRDTTARSRGGAPSGPPRTASICATCPPRVLSSDLDGAASSRGLITSAPPSLKRRPSRALIWTRRPSSRAEIIRLFGSTPKVARRRGRNHKEYPQSLRPNHDGSGQAGDIVDFSSGRALSPWGSL